MCQEELEAARAKASAQAQALQLCEEELQVLRSKAQRAQVPLCFVALLITIFEERACPAHT